MARESTRARERYYFEQFRSHFALPAGEVEYGDAPDVVIRGDTSTGIEIANLFIVDGKDPHSLQHQRRLREAVVAEAQAQYESSGGAPFEFSIDFDPDVAIVCVAPLAKRVAAAAIAAQSEPEGVISRHVHEAASEVRWMYRTGENYPDAKWRNVQSFSVPTIDACRVQEMVDGKRAKLEGYRPCDEHWLLLVVDLMDPAQDAELQWPAQTTLRRGGFERVILYKPQFAQWIEPPSVR